MKIQTLLILVHCRGQTNQKLIRIIHRRARKAKEKKLVFTEADHLDVLKAHTDLSLSIVLL